LLESSCCSRLPLGACGHDRPRIPPALLTVVVGGCCGSGFPESPSPTKDAGATGTARSTLLSRLPSSERGGRSSGVAGRWNPLRGGLIAPSRCEASRRAHHNRFVLKRARGIVQPLGR